MQFRGDHSAGWGVAIVVVLVLIALATGAIVRYVHQGRATKLDTRRAPSTQGQGQGASAAQRAGPIRDLTPP
jgi:uncharacterized protein HemX